MNDRPTYGPWRPGIDPAERRARLRALRALRAIAGIIAGPRADALVGFLLTAETDDAALDLAADALEDLDPLDLRRILSSYANRAAPPPCYVNPLARQLPRLHVRPVPRAPAQPLAGRVSSTVSLGWSASL